MKPALPQIIEAALMAAGTPLSLERLQSLFDEHEQPSLVALEQAVAELQQSLAGRGIECVRVASGYRLQVNNLAAPWVARLWDEKPQRYSRALLETLALIAYKQPITRGDIEDVRGVVVSSQIIRSLMERDWIRIVGHRETPGRPALYATTKTFLDYFGLQTLEQLPPLSAIKELDDYTREQELGADANAKVAPVDDYRFERAAPRPEQDVLAETEADLATAQALVAQVEDNVFNQDDVSDVLARLRQKHSGTLESAQENEHD